MFCNAAKVVRLSCMMAILVALLAGCASAPPTPDQLASADYGSPVSQKEAQAKASAFLRRYLKDPDSANIEWGTVGTGWVREAPIYGGTLRFGYVLEANINAKNSFGGYTGYRPYRFLFYNGSLISAYGHQELRGSTGNTAYMGKIF